MWVIDTKSFCISLPQKRNTIQPCFVSSWFTSLSLSMFRSILLCQNFWLLLWSCFLISQKPHSNKRYNLSSLKIIGTVGEPINNEAWHWYNDNVGKKRCPIVDTWWQTETGGIMIAPIPFVTPTKPTYVLHCRCRESNRY